MTTPTYEHLLKDNNQLNKLEGFGVFAVEEFINKNKDKIDKILNLGIFRGKDILYNNIFNNYIHTKNSNELKDYFNNKDNLELIDFFQNFLFKKKINYKETIKIYEDFFSIIHSEKKIIGLGYFYMKILN